ncbi:hypothetical protein [Delftia acidovorans]|uniref:hypothetical protein n=1 Tax=Delftia acidovorans TaxID=80866 RepID=UPI003D0CE4F7
MNLAGYQSKNQSEPGALQLRHSLILQQPESDENPRFPTDALPEYGDNAQQPLLLHEKQMIHCYQ